jgi:hypothetical protein
MTLDDGSADREPDAQAVRFGRVIRLENPLNRGRVEAGTRVLNRNDGVRRITHGSNGEIARAVDRTAHRLYRVDDQIEHNLLQLDAVSPDQGERIGEVGGDGHEIVDGFAVGQLDHLGDRLVEPAVIGARRCLSHHRANAAQDTGGSVAVSQNPVDGLPHTLDVRRRPTQDFQRRLGIE